MLLAGHELQQQPRAVAVLHAVRRDAGVDARVPRHARRDCELLRAEAENTFAGETGELQL